MIELTILEVVTGMVVFFAFGVVCMAMFAIWVDKHYGRR